ncbi:MAG: 4Fe-4S dicluster domain-containing protein [Bacillota bacterium]
MGYGLLFDVTKCIGCRACQAACKQYNNLPLDSDLDRRHESTNWDTPAPLTGNTLLRMNHHIVTDKRGRVAWRFVRRSCFHCERPTCEAVCFAHAFYKTPEGPVLYRRSRCVGCRYCMMGCPFSIPKYQWNELFPEVMKCRMCAPERANIGAPPACVAACPTKAVIFGDRNDLLEEAHKRIRSKYNGLEHHVDYINHVYGEHEVGGTSLLYISDVPFEELGMKTQITDKPVPGYTDTVLKWTVGVAAVWGAALTTLYVATKKQDEQEAGH